MAIVVSGCGVKAASELPVRTLEDGRLSVYPRPVTLADQVSDPAGSPRDALLGLWFSIQWWDEPAIVSAYAPVVSEVFPKRTILGAWDLRRGSMVGSRPGNLETTRNGRFTIVTFRRESRVAPPGIESVTMVRQGGRWRILHDTMLEDALAAFAQLHGPRGQDAQSPAAVRRGIQTSRRFRDLAAGAPRRPR